MFWSTRKSVELSLRYENVYIHPTAEIGEDVEIGPFSYVGPSCRIGEGTRLHNNVTLVANTVLGERNEVYPGAVLGAIPQDKKYDGENSWLVIGSDNTIRECVTLHGGTRLGGGVTKIGDRNLLMASCHVAHDCILGDAIITANNVLFGGHVRVESYATIGGLAAVHHFVTVGRYSFIGGMTRVSRDVPPYMLVEGHPAKVRCVNKVGLRRHNFSEKKIQELKDAHRLIYRSRLPRRDTLLRIERAGRLSAELKTLIAFLRKSERGKLGRARQP